MERRHLGRAGLSISEVGFGAWGIGGDAWGPVKDEQSQRAIERALEVGIDLIDTADVYGDGRSETVIGRAVRGRREQVVLSTKGGLMGHHRDPEREPVYDRPEKVVEALEASLRRLGTDHVDIYWCHIWWDRAEETEAFLAAFARLREDGKIRAAGISTDSLDHVRHFHRDGGVDAVQVDYSILNRAAESGILPYAQEHGLGVLVRGPLFKGLLTGKFDRTSTYPVGDIRHEWMGDARHAANLATVDRLEALDRGDLTLGQLALRFVLSHPAVTAPIPGAKTVEQVEENAAASGRPLLPDELLRAIDEVAPGPSAIAS
jgi:aryl-alcohol dehydrogenase-like predicted oxidoreductase